MNNYSFFILKKKTTNILNYKHISFHRNTKITFFDVFFKKNILTKRDHLVILLQLVGDDVESLLKLRQPPLPQVLVDAPVLLPLLRRQVQVVHAVQVYLLLLSVTRRKLWMLISEMCLIM